MLLKPISAWRANTGGGGSWSPSLVDNQGTASITAVDDPGDSAFFSMAFFMDPSSVSGTQFSIIRWGRHVCNIINDTLDLDFKNTAATTIASGTTSSCLSVGTLTQIVILCRTAASGTKYLKVYADGTLVLDVPDGSVTAGTMDHSRTDKLFLNPDMQRMGALWVDADTDPDTFSISDFWSGGAAVDYTSLGTPNYVVDGAASVWNAGTNSGNLSNFSVTGTYIDA